MKLTLRFNTTIGPRVGVLEVSDEITASAILNAHLGQNGEADDEVPCGAIRMEVPRLSLRDHLSRHKRRQERAGLALVQADPKVTRLRRPKP